MISIENKYLKVCIKELGAELCGIYSKETELEYMWQPGFEIWDHSSLTLFPNNGRIYKDRAIIGGKVYRETMQGFAKFQVFDVVEKTEDKAVLELSANETTKLYLPYPRSFPLRQKPGTWQSPA